MADDRDLINQAKKRHKHAVDAWADIYQSAKDDMLFLSDDDNAQWDDRDFAQRRGSSRPALTIDQVSQFVHQVENDVRMNTPTINVIPGGKDSDAATAEVFKGLIKNIEYSSGADICYDTALSSAVRCGIGFIRIDHDYSDDETFDQDLIFRRVPNPLNVFIDPETIDPNGCDLKYATVIDKILASDFKKKYKGFEPVSFESDDDDASGDDEYISIAEHFYIEDRETEISQEYEGETKTRKSKKTIVHRLKMTGKDILERTVFPGKYIPIIPVFGEEHWVSGKRKLFSLIRKSKDAQRRYNYWVSLETELLMKQPKAQFIAAAGSVENYKEGYNNPDKASVLLYEANDARGNPVPPPMPLPPPSIPSGIVQAARSAIDDIKATMGLYNAALGMRSNEQSGVAIAQRKVEGDVATFHFGDNLKRSIEQCGRVLVSAIPEIYDTARILRIIGDDDEAKSVGVNGEVADTQPVTFDLKKGKYDVKVITGAPFTTRRQEALVALQEVFKAAPDLMTVMGDLYFKNADFSGAQAMAERMKKVIDPKFLDEETPNQNDPEKMQLNQALQQSQAAMQAMQVEMMNLQNQIKDKQADIALKAQSEQNDAQESKAKIEVQLLELRLKEQELAAENQLRLMELQLKEQELFLKRLELERANQIAAVSAQSPDNQVGAI